MRAGIKKGLATAVAVVSATAAVVLGVETSGSAATVPTLQAYGIALGGTRMIAFKTSTPEQQDWVRVITGLVGDTYAVGLDMRVQDKKLYVVGDKGGIYTIGIPTAVVTKVSQLQVPLYGTKFGVDFNPAADRLRIVSDTGQNLAHNLANSQTATNTPLTTDGATTQGVSAVAYTNNDLNGATNTTLYDINTNTDQLVIQSPPANGLLVAVGSLGVDAAPNAGFDIFSDLSAGKTISVTGFATLLSSSGKATFYTVNLFTGETTNVGDFPIPMGDVAVALDPNP